MTVNSTVSPSAHVAPVGVIPPKTQAPGSVSTGWVSMAQLAVGQAIVQAGTLASGASVAAKLEQAKTDAGGAAKDVDGKTITPLSVSDKVAVLDFRAGDLDVNGGYAFVRLTLTVAGANAGLAATMLGLSPRYGKASDHAAEAVVEIVPG
ncbi:hypothetical protein GAY33_09485 [Azospirillum brasilense]|uniref:hypothetical protein n=1 Tax=Azospirillum argentinense TaxID=2970906 RepID=UPI00190CACB5|nr:hypothetical protein [Azospirillum argentinense]MBK3799455.1 hypothetical protein [Azospirillum argentinense]